MIFLLKDYCQLWETDMLLSKGVPTLHKVDGREFVDVEDFLKCYPDADERVKNKVKGYLATFDGDVEKRVEDPLMDQLLNICLSASRRDGALSAPIVLCDGWVIWVGKGHEPLIDALGALMIGRKEPERDINEVLAELSGDIPSEPHKFNIDLLTRGFGWYISTSMPRIIWTGKAYRMSRTDRAIFDLFQVRHIDG